MFPTFRRAALALVFLLDTAHAAPVDVTVLPTQPLIEQGKHQQLLNIDFRIDNHTTERIELSEVQVDVLGAADRLLAQYRVGANGMSVLVVPNRFVDPNGAQLVFNPLVAFPDDLDLSRLRFSFKFDVGATTRYTATTVVSPRHYRPQVQLQLPVAGPVLVYDGHDFHGHHRRLPLLDPMAQALRWQTNFMRYSYDFVVTDAQGRMYRNDGARNEDWFGWGAPVSAPAAGTVLRVVNNMPDNRKGRPPAFSREQFVADPSLMWGNHVEIDHGNGEISLLAHLQQGSVTVRPGDVVQAGQPIGKMGFSGDAFLVHLHYDLKNGPGFGGDGLPAPFHGFERLTGPGWTKVASGQIDSGDVVRRTVAPAVR